jgi:hypothetical protein
MSLLVLNVVVWGIAVYSFKVAFSGRMSLRLLATTPQSTVQLAADFFQSDQTLSDASDDVHLFLSRLAQVRLFSLSIVLIEYSVCAYFLNINPQDPVAWFIVTKNLLIVVMLIRTRNETMDLDPIQSLIQTPGWVKRWERIMHLFTGLCLLVQFTRMNFSF